MMSCSQKFAQFEMDPPPYKRNNEFCVKNETKKGELKNAHQLEKKLHFSEDSFQSDEKNNNAELIILRGETSTGKTDVIIEKIIEAVTKNKQILVITRHNFANTQFLKFVERVFYDLRIPTTDKTFMDDQKYNHFLRKYEPHSGMSDLQKTQAIMENVLVVFCRNGSFMIERSQNETTFCPKLALIDDVHLENQGIRVLYETMTTIIATENSLEHPTRRVYTNVPWSRTGLCWSVKPRNVEAYGIKYKLSSDVEWWSSEYFCNDIYNRSMSIATNSLRDLPCMREENRKELKKKLYASFVCCNTENVKGKENQMSYYEKVNMEGSYFNEGEARIAVQHARNLLRQGVQPEMIAILTTFDAQKRLIMARLKFFGIPSSVEVAKVQNFSNQNKEVIIFSYVRYNPMVEFGLFNPTRLLHTAITSAKCQFFYIGSLWMLSQAIMPYISLWKAFRTRTIGTIVSPDMVYGGVESKFIRISHSFGSYFEYFIEACEENAMRKKCIIKAKTLH